MLPAAGIEGGAASGAGFGRGEVVLNRQPRAALPAQNRRLLEPLPRPTRRRVIRHGLVTLDAGIISVAARESDGDDVARPAPVRAAAARVNLTPVDFDALDPHRFSIAGRVRFCERIRPIDGGPRGPI